MEKDKEELLKCIYGKVEDLQFKLDLLEMVGSIVLMLHWQRGIIDSLVQNENVKLSQEQLDNWNRVIENLSYYEQYTWEIAPSRALLPLMRHFRLTGKLIEDFELLSKKDELGRIPYNLTDKEYDDIQDIFRRIKDARETAIHSGAYGHALSVLNIGK